MLVERLLKVWSFVTIRTKVNTSKQWYLRHVNDPYVKRAQLKHYRARSAFKLLEMDERFQILAHGMLVVDCGAAPGSWTQVIAQKINCSGTEPNSPIGMAIAIDRNWMEPVDDVIILQNTDMFDSGVIDLVNSHLHGRKLDAVLSDMAPNATGSHELDHERILKLCYLALQFSVRMLKKQRGRFLCKMWSGREEGHFRTVMKKFFAEVHVVKPLASRLESTETYLLGKGFKGATDGLT